MVALKTKRGGNEQSPSKKGGEATTDTSTRVNNNSLSKGVNHSIRTKGSIGEKMQEGILQGQSKQRTKVRVTAA